MADALLMVGTQKALFLVRLSGGRQEHEVIGPLFSDEQVYSVAADARRDPPRLLAGVTDDHWGTVVRISDDLGETWTDPEVGNLRFPADVDAAVARIWQLHPAGENEPDVVYAGVEPAALFRSDDGGTSFDLVRGLWDHPHRPVWQPGGGGLCLHTVLVNRDDPARLLIAISSAGVYRSDDGGASWRPSNDGIHSAGLPEDFPEFGQCVHRVAADPVVADTLYAQNHGGLYRSDDFGGSWQDVANGVPSDFGFPIATHPRDGGVAYIVPLTADSARWPVDGRCEVYRTADGGGSWEGLGEGLPDGAYFSVLRDALCTDRADPAGIYFGTRSGEVYGSTDEGETWRRLAEHLPPVLSVRALTLA